MFLIETVNKSNHKKSDPHPYPNSTPNLAYSNNKSHSHVLSLSKSNSDSTSPLKKRRNTRLYIAVLRKRRKSHGRSLKSRELCLGS